MPQYSDYQNLLLSHNFIGGAGKIQIPNIGNDERAEITQIGDIYQFDYLILAGLSDLDNSGVIDAPDEYTTGHIAIGQLDGSYSNFSGTLFSRCGR